MNGSGIEGMKKVLVDSEGKWSNGPNGGEWK